jgi:acyl-coenzyme A synthetase/AMP-(fatty) acid ligase
MVRAEAAGFGDLRAFSRRRPAPHKVPVRWFAIDALPRNRVGKVERELVGRFRRPKR